MKKRNILFVLLASTLVACNDTTTSSLTSSSNDSSLNSSVETSSSESSSSEVQKYTITAGDNSITVDKYSAAAGETVTVTVTVPTDKGLIELKSNVEGVTFIKGTTANTYTFTMPSSNITITPVYGNLHKVAKFTSYGVPGVSYTTEDKKYIAGTEVTIEFAVDSARENDLKNSVDKLYVHVNNLVVKPTFGTTLTATFTMPDIDLDISLIERSSALEEATEGGVQIVCEGDTQYVKFLGFDPNKRYTYESQSRPFIKVVLEKGYKFKTAECKADEATEYQTADVSADSMLGDGVYSIYLSAATSKITLKVEGEYVGVRTITYEGGEGITWNNGQSLPTEFMEGEPLHIYNLALSDEKKYIKDVKVTTSNGDEITDQSVSASKGYDGSFGIHSNSMPNYDIKITFVLSDKHKVTVEQNEHISNVSITEGYSYSSSPTEYFKPRDNVNVSFTCTQGYRVTQAKLSNGSEPIEIYSGNTSFSFTMPETDSDITITLTVVQEFKASFDFSSIAEDSGVKGSFGYSDSSHSYVEGEEVSGSISFDNHLYSLTSISVKDHSEFTVNVHDGNRFSFTMPAYDVVLVVTATKSEPQSLELTTPTDDNIESVEIQGTKTGYGKMLSYSKNLNDGQQNTLKLDFVPSDTLSVRVVVAEQETKIPVVKFEGVSEGKTYLPERKYPYNGVRYDFGNIELPSGATKISVSLQEKPTWNIEVTNQSNVELVYKVNNQPVDNLNGVGLFDELNISLKDDARGVYTITLKGKDDSETLFQGENTVTWLVSKEFTVEVKKDETKHAVHKTNNAGEGIEIYGSIRPTVDNNYKLQSYDIYIYNTSDTAKKINVVLKVGDDEVINKTSQDAIGQYGEFKFIEETDSITVTDDLYIIVTAVTE